MVAYTCSQEEKVRGSTSYDCEDRQTFQSSGMMPHTLVYILTNIYEEPEQIKSKWYRIFFRCVIPVVCRINQNVMCTQYVVKHNLVLDGMLIY